MRKKINSYFVSLQKKCFKIFLWKWTSQLLDFFPRIIINLPHFAKSVLVDPPRFTIRNISNIFSFFFPPFNNIRSFSLFQVKLEGRTQFLSAVCMTCLEGWGAGRRLRCLYCATPWDGSSLVIGTMYSYDIFAAMPCCTERLRVSVSYTRNRK